MDRVPPTKNTGSFPLVIGLTALVLVVPCLAAIGLRASGLVTSPVLLILIPVVVSVLFSHSISEIWKRRRAGSPLLFEDLMLWGWLRRRRFERLLARSEEFVGPEAGRGLTPKQRAKELERLVGALEARDPRTHGHSRRVARHSTSIARSLKLSDEEIARIRTAALLHDVGKIEVPWEILEKPGALTDEEFAEIKKHPAAGARLVQGMGDPALVSIVRHHHERIDGGGYPDRIAGEEIPIGARIIAVADTFDALTSARSYRQPRSHEEALVVLREEAGSQLDADAVEVFDGRYSSRRPVALVATVLGIGRQAGQSMISFGTGATQVAAVGAAAAVIGAAPAAQLGHQQKESSKQPAIVREAGSAEGGEGTSEGTSPTTVAARSSSTGSKKKSATGRGRVQADTPGKQDGGKSGGDDANTSSGNGNGNGNGNSGGSTDNGSGGSSSGGSSSSGGGSSGGGSSSGSTATDTVKTVTENVQKQVQQTTQQVTDAIPTLPGNDPVSQGVNNTVGGVKDTVNGVVGKLTGKP
jgi:putative nucleotidyltransferase with HDIG domain